MASSIKAFEGFFGRGFRIKDLVYNIRLDLSLGFIKNDKKLMYQIIASNIRLQEDFFNKFLDKNLDYNPRLDLSIGFT